MIEENKAIVLEDGSKYLLLKKVVYQGHNYALALSLEDKSKFCILQLGTTNAKFVKGKNLMALVLIEIMKDEKFISQMKPNFQEWKNGVLKLIEEI